MSRFIQIEGMGFNIQERKTLPCVSARGVERANPPESAQFIAVYSNF